MKNTLFITGAGVSSESGIPTFRGKDGFWTIGSEKLYSARDGHQGNVYEKSRRISLLVLPKVYQI